MFFDHTVYRIRLNVGFDQMLFNQILFNSMSHSVRSSLVICRIQSNAAFQSFSTKSSSPKFNQLFSEEMSETYFNNVLLHPHLGSRLWPGQGGEGDGPADGYQELRDHEQHLQGMSQHCLNFLALNAYKSVRRAVWCRVNFYHLLTTNMGPVARPLVRLERLTGG